MNGSGREGRRCGPPGRRSSHARGIVTVEFACGILASIIVMIMLSWAIFLFGARIALIDAAGEIARQSARGDSAAVHAAERNGPTGADYTIRRSQTTIVVVALLQVRPLSAMPSFTVRATSEAALEPGQQQVGR